MMNNDHGLEQILVDYLIDLTYQPTKGSTVATVQSYLKI